MKVSLKEKSDKISSLSDSGITSNPELKAYKSKALPNYKGEILLKIESKNEKYLFSFSLDGGVTYDKLAETPDNLLLGMMYTGANIGVYATSNGQKTQGYVDFEWVKYKGFIN